MSRNYQLRVAMEKHLKDRITTVNDRGLSEIYAEIIPCSKCIVSQECMNIKHIDCIETIEFLLRGDIENGTD